MEICSVFKQIDKIGDFYIVHTNNADIKIYFLNDEIVRVRSSFDKKFAEESYILQTTAWEDRLDFLFEGERVKVSPVEPTLLEDEKSIRFKTKKITLILEKDPICFKLYNDKDELLYSDVSGNPYTLDSNNRLNHYSEIGYDDCFYGFGEKPGVFNKHGHFMKLSAKDAMGYDPVKIDSLYKHIPFYIKLNRKTGNAIGLFYNNFNECSFNMGREKSNYWPYYSVWQCDGGDIDLFFIGGNKINKIIDNYTYLTGRPALMPKRAIGYQGSSMFYPELAENSDDAVLEFVDTIKEEGFPIDGFHLSSGYTSKDNKRYVFTWNKKRFKNPSDYFSRMNQKGAQNVPNVKPGILLTHPYFEDFNQKDVFVKDSKNKEIYSVGKWWGGEGAFFDFTKPEARDVWKDYLTKNIIEIGTSSVWNDNCEYDSLLDKDAVCDNDGVGGTIGALKPVMSTIMCKITHEAINEYDKNARPYVVCRSGSAGIQKYAQTWCGDNLTSWDSLKYNISTILGMSMSGCPNEGSDIGGFHGRAPEEELFVRWVQQGIFQARFSIHSTNSDNTVTEPWMFKNSTEYIREAILLRYRFMPYLYSNIFEATLNGAPIMRPLVYEFQEDEKCFDEGFNYMFGRDILVANVIEKGATKKRIYLPKSCKWYDFWTLECFEGGQIIEISVDINTIPMFIRQGAIIPVAENQIMSMENDEVKKLRVIISPNGTSKYTLYNDDGKTNDYLSGKFLKTNIEVIEGEITSIDVSREGEIADCIEQVTYEVIAKEKSPFWITIDEEQITHYLNRRKFEQSDEGWYYSQTKKMAIIKIKNRKSDYKIRVSFEKFDLIGM